MAKKAKCERCQVWWHIQVKDQTPLRMLCCPYCAGPVKPVYSPIPGFYLAKGEPVLAPPGVLDGS
jgi:hypothetical protein